MHCDHIVHIDLFSGIGGFALAVDAVWPDAEHIFCEIDPFCRALLKKRFKGSVFYGDIREFTANAQRMRKLQPKGCKFDKRGRPCYEIDLLTGGFPCQPFSQAGRRKGTADDRHLWPEMFRVIREFKPRWVIGENVAGLLSIEQGLVFEQVCLDLEGEGYEVQAFVIPAVAVNAPHRRDRVWIVAHSKNIGNKRRPEEVCEADGRQDGELRTESNGANSNAQNSNIERGSGGMESGGQILERQSSEAQDQGPDWSRHWVEVATELCRVDDGLPAELDGLKLFKSKHRAERLKALGNSIVPAVAIEIMKAIKQCDQTVCGAKIEGK